VSVRSRRAIRFGGCGDARDNAPVVEPRRAPGNQPLGRILVVDDEPDLVTILTKYFSDAGYTVDAASHGGDALIAVSQYQPDVVVLDVLMEGLDGVQVLQRIRSLDPAIRVIMITGSSDTTLKPTTMSMGAFAYVSKPVSLQLLHEAVSAAFSRSDPFGASGA
jgi:two-component system, OmpR family, response regulator